MKRILAGGLVAGLIFGLAACSNDATLEDPSTTRESVPEPETVVETVTDAAGNIVLDENGEPMTEIVTVETVEVPVLDENGNQVIDENGKPVTKTETQKKPVIPASPSGNTGGQQGGSSGSGSGTGNNKPSGGSGNSGNTGNSGGNTGNTGSSGNSGGNQEKPTDPPKQEQTPQPDPTPERTWEYLEAESRAAFDAMNEFRKQNGVAPLIWRQDCQDAANKQAKWCAENSTMYHTEAQISQGCWTADADVLIQRWADSPGHRANMLDTLNVYGAVSIYRDSNNYYYVIAHFEMKDGIEWQ